MQLTPDSETANRFHIISRLADDLAHEIKNPLNSMVINLEVLRSRARKSDVDGILARADVIETEIRRLNGLVEGLLRLLRPDRNASAVVPVDALLSELDEMVGLQARLSRKELNVSLIGDGALTAGRRDALRYALLNLVCAELDAVGGPDARIDVGGRMEGSGSVITITTVGGEPVAGSSEQRAAAVQVASALLAGAGGAVEAPDPATGREERTMSVRLPGARPA